MEFITQELDEVIVHPFDRPSSLQTLSHPIIGAFWLLVGRTVVQIRPLCSQHELAGAPQVGCHRDKLLACWLVATIAPNRKKQIKPT